VYCRPDPSGVELPSGRRCATLPRHCSQLNAPHYNSPMEISPNLFARAQKLNRPAVEALFASVYPAVLRIARGLSGRIAVPDGVVRFVMLRAPAMLPRWRDATA